MNCYGVRGTANNWFSSYFENRTQFVSINGYFSDLYFICCGVLQGSISWPSLFVISELVKGVIPSPSFSKIPPFLEIQDVPTFYRPIRKAKVLNESFNQFVYKFYPQSILILEEYLLKRWNANLIMPLDVFWSILWKMGIS